jgi:hypothetical protein
MTVFEKLNLARTHNRPYSVKVKLSDAQRRSTHSGSENDRGPV